MTKEISVGIQKFEDVIDDNTFYVDKTKFIEEWWKNDTDVSLITRPRRFGKTLMMSTVKCFFSNQYEGRKDLFNGLYISAVPEMMALQGTFPVIALSFAECKNLKESEEDIPEFVQMVRNLKRLMSQKFFELKGIFEKSGDKLSENDQRMFTIICGNDRKEYTDAVFGNSIQMLCRLLIAHYGKQPIIILDEYDTPLQEAYTHGYWQPLVELMRNLFNTSFKTPDYYKRVLLTGITRISKQSLFSDVNNFDTYSVTSGFYADCFGFTEKEVFDALDEYGLSDEKQNVKDWYDGFVFGALREIYNPYSIVSFIYEKKIKTYWADTSSNEMVSWLIRHGSDETREDFQKLMKNEAIHCMVDENVVFEDLMHVEGAVWSLLLCSGCLKAIEIVDEDDDGEPLEQPEYLLAITNKETRIMFKKMVRRWFSTASDSSSYNGFINALRSYDLEDMNRHLNKITVQSCSYFDNSESFWQGFTIGLTVSLDKDYYVTPNRIAGTGRYDLQLKPKDKSQPAFIFELKNIDAEKKGKRTEGQLLKAAVREALKQIETRKYYTELVMEGYPIIHKLGLAYKGQLCLIGDENTMKTRRRKTSVKKPERILRLFQL